MVRNCLYGGNVTSLNLFKNVPKNIYIKMANTKDELEQAYAILHDNYVSENLMEPHVSEIRATYYNMLPQTTTIIAKVADQVVGTLSIINNDSMILPLERELDRADYKSPAHSSAQILDFSMRSDFKYSNINFLLMKYAYEYCRDFLKVQTVQIAVKPKHASFYSYAFGFLPISKTYFDSGMNGEVFIPMQVHLQDAYDYMAINFGKRRENSNFFFYFTKFNFSQFFEFPERKFYVAHDPVMTPEILDYFFNYKTSLLSNLSPEQLEYIQYVYDSPEYKKIIPKLEYNVTYLNLRRGKRFPVNCDGEITNPKQSINIQINNVSPNGFSAKLQGGQTLVINEIFDANILISDFNVTSIKAKVVWKKSHIEYGFCLVKSSPNWNEFIEYLYKRLDKNEDFEDDEKFAA